MAPATAEKWSASADIYMKKSEATTAKPIAAMLEDINSLLPFSEATGILDNGSGPGPCMAQILQKYGQNISQTCTLICSDWSTEMIEGLKNTKAEALAEDPNSIWSRVDARILDAMDLNSIPDGSISHVTASWVYHMTGNHQKCLSETIRVLKPGGVVGITSWKEIEWLLAMKPITKINPELSPPWGAPEFTSISALSAELEKHGFKDVKVREVPVELPFQTHAQFVDMMCTKLPPLVTMLETLSEEQRESFRSDMTDEVARFCPQEPGALKGIALAAVGRK